MANPDVSEYGSVAILSDIHANQVALRAVLADLDKLGVDEIVVAGDLVGFGPNPDAVVDLLIERGARLIRGNHEKDYVAAYRTPAMPPTWLTDPRLRSMIWSMERIGPQRRRFLSELPDALSLDADTLVVHGSPRHIRDAVLASTPEAELDRMFAGHPARLAFMGHTHRPLIRTTAARRLVNAGSVGLPLDGDPRASYALAEKRSDRDDWTVEIRRVAYDLDAAIAAYDNGLRDVDPGYVEILSRQLRSARDYFGPWLRLSKAVPDAELPAALERFLAGRGRT
jgi:predicted phosphodiesterase